MTGVAALDPDLSRHWPKRLARLMGVPVVTARFWAYQRMPAARRREIALALIAECDRLERVIAETKQRWQEVADDAGSGAVAGGEADRAGAPARRVGRKVSR